MVIGKESTPEVKKESTAENGSVGEMKTVMKFQDARWITGTWDLKQFEKDGKLDWDTVIIADLYGVIKKIWNPERILYVPRDDEQDYHPMAVRFKIVDHVGSFLKCCAIGDSCVDFMTKWRECDYDINYINRPKVL